MGVARTVQYLFWLSLISLDKDAVAPVSSDANTGCSVSTGIKSCKSAWIF